MDYKSFQSCFNKLCNTFDLDYEKKQSRIESYFESQLGDLSEHNFLEVIKKAGDTLNPKAGHLPRIQELLSIYYNNTSRPQKAMEDMENFNQAKCAICDGLGSVVMEKGGYTYSGMCCTCRIGQIKQRATKIGQNAGCYTDYLEQGYSLVNGEVEKVPF